MLCDICSHFCILSEGNLGKCKIIAPVGGRLVNRYKSYCSVVAVDSIEKRPFFHFLPGAKCLSIGFFGCSLNCSFCQNYKITQKITGYSYFCDIPVTANEKQVDVIAFSYNEPTLHYEYIREVAGKIDKPIVVKSNGFATSQIWNELKSVVAAYNIDIKGDEREYKETCGGSLSPVIASIELLKSFGHHIEISYLVLNSAINDLVRHRRMAKWLSSLSPFIPVHILFIYPCHKMIESYYHEQLLPIYDIFRSVLNFVYISNVYDDVFMQYRDTYCPYCKKLMVSRRGSVKINTLSCCGQGYF